MDEGPRTSKGIQDYITINTNHSLCHIKSKCVSFFCMENAPITGCYSFLVCGFNIDRIHELGQLLASSSMGIPCDLQMSCDHEYKVLTWNHGLVTLKNFWWGFQKYTTCARRMTYGWDALSRRYLEKDQQKFCDLSSNSLFSVVFKRLNCFCLSCLFLEISCSKQKPAFRIIFLLMAPKTQQHWSSLKKFKTESAICPAVTFQCRIKSHCLLIVLCWKLKVLVSSTKHFGAFRRKVKSFLTSRGSTLKYITFHLKGKRETLLNTMCMDCTVSNIHL